MNQRSSRSLKTLFASSSNCVLLLSAASCAFARTPSTNIALGKPVAFSAKPNYTLAVDPDDNIQLTDGKYSSEGKLQEVENTNALWVQKGTVGWQDVMPVKITIDLGAVQPISGISYSTAAGRSNVSWPTALYIAVSDDNETWHAVGDLVSLSRKNGAPPLEGYANFRYLTRDLKTHGRYISVISASVPFTFVDEIEVYAGDQQWLNAPAGGTVFRDFKEYVAQNMDISATRRRLYNDADAVRSLVQASGIPAQRRSALLTRLEKQVAATGNLTSLPADFKAIVPLNDIHRDILAVHGELLAAQGVNPLTVWKQHRYDWLPLIAKPAPAPQTELNFSMLRNQFRSDALLLTNAGTKPRTVNLKLTGPPHNVQTDWLKVDSVEWTDTQSGLVVPDALIPLTARNGEYSVTIPAGMTRKVWLTVNSSKVPAGNTRSTLEVSGGSSQIRVPVTFNISSITMNKPRLSLGMWDYTNANGYYGINPQNRDAAIALMRSHFVDTPWGSPKVLPRPDAAAFDKQNNLQAKLDFSSFDEWIARWPGARRYFVYANAGSTFADVHRDTPEFHARVGSWAKALSAHMKELGLQPNQLGILLVDEPKSDAQDILIAAWAKAIKATAPELTLFSDPVWPRPDQTKIQEAITQMDVLTPNVPKYYAGGKLVRDYYQKLREQGKELWFYQCSGPVRPFDPQVYYRYQAWHTFSIGGRGQGFWSFASTGKAVSSWNEYSAPGINFAPVFFDKETVHSSVHWDAVREGMQDYEELAMLQDAIAASNDATLKAQAQKTLNAAVKAITDTYKYQSGNHDWSTKRYVPELADGHLQKVRAMLEKLKV